MCEILKVFIFSLRLKSVSQFSSLKKHEFLIQIRQLGWKGSVVNHYSLPLIIFLLSDDGIRDSSVMISRITIHCFIQGVPRNMTVGRRLESCFNYLNSFVTTDNQVTSLKILETLITKCCLSFFCAVNITEVIKNLVQVSFVLNKTIIVESWTEFFRSWVILQAQTMQTTFSKCQDSGYFVIINSRILLLLFFEKW